MSIPLGMGRPPLRRPQGCLLPQGAWSMRDAPPIFFLRHQKENAPRPVEKKKCSAGRSAQAQTSCRRRGMAGGPARQSGTETPDPWGILCPGEVWDTLSLPPRCRSLALHGTRQRVAKRNARKEELVKCVLAPRPKMHRAAGINHQVCPAPRRARSPVLANPQAPSHADPRTATLHACAKLRPKRLFLLHRARRVLFLGKTKKRTGGASASHQHGCFPGQWAST